MHVGLKLTKHELKKQKNVLAQLNRYLPILKLRKSLLEQKLETEKGNIAKKRLEYKDLFSSMEKKKMDFFLQSNVTSFFSFLINDFIYENVGGVSLPIFQGVVFKKNEYSIYATMTSTESTIKSFEKFIQTKEDLRVCCKRIAILELELRRASIRSNLIEKILIPRANNSILKISVFLMDMELAAIGRAKIAKKKRMSVL